MSECVPKVAAAARPTVILAWRPAAERAPDAGAQHRDQGNRWSVSYETHAFGSVDFVFLTSRAPILPDYAHFFPMAQYKVQ